MTYQFRLREEPFDFSYGFDDYENGLLESDLEFADLEELFDPEFADMEWEAEVDRSSREYLRWVQSSLNKILGLRLAVDGISGTATRSAVRSFQQQKGLTPDGIIGPITEAALIAAGASAPPAAGTISTPSTGTIPNVNALLPSYVPSRTTSTTLPLAWGAKVSPAFRARVRQIGGELGINPNFLMAAMAFETNETFDPSIRNPYSGATGLIQFTATTAGKLGTSTDSLARMSAEQQLDYVAAYFRPYKGQLKTIEDVYMAVLYGPEAVGVPNDTVLFSTPSREYEWNKALDSNRDGRITKAEAAAPVIARLNKGMQAALQGELHALENPWRGELSLSGRLQEQKWERPFSEGEEVDLAAELLSVSNEEELDQFLGKLFKGAWKGLKKVGSVVGKFAKPLGRVLKGVATRAQRIDHTRTRIHTRDTTRDGVHT